MKWAIFYPRLLPDAWGGVSVYVHRYAKALVACGDDVHIFCVTWDSEKEGEEQLADGYIVHRVLIPNSTVGPFRILSAQKITRDFNRIDRVIKFDVINVHSPFIILTNILNRRIPIIHTVHAVVTYEYIYEIIKMVATGSFLGKQFGEFIRKVVAVPIVYYRERLALARANHIVVMSEYVKKTLTRFFPNFIINKVFISRIGIDSVDFTPAKNKNNIRQELKIPDDNIVFFCARRLVLRMGIANLIKAIFLYMKERKDNRIKLYISGKGELYKKINKMIKKYGLEECVFLLGFINNDKLRMFYQASDAFILPTEELEGFGIVSIEALLCNLPIISTPVGANPEVSGRFCPELLTKSCHPNAIVEKMVFFVNNINAYKNCNYRDAVISKYSWPDILSEIKKIYLS